LLDGGEIIDRGSANLARNDLYVAGKRDGSCGFAFNLPAALIDGRPHSLRVRVVPTAYEVPNGPIVFGPARALDLFAEIAGLGKEVRRLSDVVGQLMQPDSVLLRDIIGSLHERSVMMAEIQRDLVERELDALRKFAFAAAGDISGGIRRHAAEAPAGTDGTSSTASQNGSSVQDESIKEASINEISVSAGLAGKVARGGLRPSRAREVC
jgi:hypothetical protein